MYCCSSHGDHSEDHCPVCSELDTLRARVAELEALVRGAIQIQETHYGNGMMTHIELHPWADEAKTHLNP